MTLTGSIVGAPLTTPCSSGTYTKSIQFTGADGAKTVVAEQMNAYGNTGNDSRAFALDTTRPSVILSSTATSPTRLSSIPVTVTFSESVTDFDETDLTLVNASVTSVSGPGSSYTFDLHPSAEGLVSVLVKNAAAMDAAGNTSEVSTPLTFTSDTTAPTVTLARAPGQTALSNSLPIHFTMTLSEAALESSLSVADFSLSGTASSGANLSLSKIDDTHFTVSVTSAIATSGRFTLDMPTGRFTDPAGNTNEGALASMSVDYDAEAPTFSGLAVSPISPASEDRPTFSGTTEEASAVTLHKGNDCSSSSIASTTADSTGGFSLTPASGLGADGTYSLRAKAIDAAGNSTCSSAVNYVLDTEKPSITVARASGQNALSNSLPILFTLTFSEPINPASFDLSKITRSGSASGVTWSLATTDNTVYTLSATAITGSGSVTVSIADDQASDLAGHLNTGSLSSATVTYDHVEPSFSGLAVSPVSPGSNPRPTLSGTTEASSNVSLHLDSSCGDSGLASGSADASSGAFSLTPSSDLGADGSYDLYVKAIDTAGNSACSSAVVYVLDSAAKSLVIASAGLGPSPSNSTSSRTVTISSADATHYKAVVIASGLCTAADFSSATETDIATSFSFTPAANASSTVCAIGKSSAGVWEGVLNAASSSKLVIDTVAPSLSGVSSSPSTLSYVQKPTLSGTTESNASVELHAASGCGDAALGLVAANSSGAFSLQPASDLAEGSHSLYLKATDAAGNSTCSSSALAYRVDVTTPTLVLTKPASGDYISSTNASSFTVIGTCSEDATIVVSASDGSQSKATGALSCSLGSFTSSLDLSSFNDGSVTFSLSGSDAAGNEATSITRTISKDTLAPTATLSGLPVSPANATSLNVTVAGTGVAHYKAKVGAAASTDCSDSSGYSAETPVATAITSSLSGISDGSIKLCVIGRDAAGNYQTLASAASHTWVKDTTAPTLSIAAPTAGGFLNSSNVSSVTVSGSCSENGRAVLVSATSGSTVSDSVSCSSGAYSTTLNLSSLTDGAFDILVNHTDAAGNDATQASVSVTKDTQAPTATLSGTPSHPSKVTSLDVTVGGTDVTHYKYKFGLASGLDCSASSGYIATPVAVATHLTGDLSSLADGPLRLCVVGLDTAGNLQAYSSATSHSWTKDTLAPSFSSMSSNPASAGQEPKPTISGVTEPSSTVALYSGLACSGSPLADGTANATTGTFALTPSSDIGADGLYAFTVLATDLAGNSFCLSSPVIYTLDRVAPSLAVTSPSSGSYVQGSFTITGTCEGSLSVVFSGSGLQSGSPATCSSGTFSQTLTLTSGEGAKDLVVSSTDLAGNTASVNLSLTRDDTAPVLTFASPAAGTYHATGLTISGTCEAGLTVNISGTGVSADTTAPCDAGSPGTFSKAITFSATDGNKDVIVSQTDAAGNVGTATRIFERYTPREVNFSVASQDVAENQGTATVTLTLSSASNKTITVPITRGGTATESTDYSLSTTSVVFAPSDTSKTITVTLIDDTTAEALENIVLGMGTITDGTAGATAPTHTLYMREPSLDLNFASLVNDGQGFSTKGAPYDTITFTRASIGTYFDADGRMKVAQANVPRFDHDPVTGQPKGLLIEESRTNLLAAGSDMLNSSYWTINTSYSVAQSIELAPDGSSKAFKIISTNATSDFGTSSNITSGQPYTASVFAKAGETPYFMLRTTTSDSGFNVVVNLQLGTIISAAAEGTGTYISGSANITNLGNGWYRVSAAGTVPSSTAAVRLKITNSTGHATGDGTSGLYIWGAQLEAGSFPTSYIPTTTAVVTRSADSARISDISFWYTQGQGTMFATTNASFIPPVQSQWFAHARLADRTNNSNFIVLQTALPSTEIGAQIITSGVPQSYQPQTLSTLGLKKLAVAFSTNDVQHANSGQLIGSIDTSANIPAVDELQIGTVNINGSFSGRSHYPIARITHFNKRLSNATVLHLTSTSQNFRSITPTAQFTLASQAVLESTSKAYVTVMLDEPSTNTVTIPYTIGTGSPNAVSGTDYANLVASGSFTLAAGETRKTISVDITHRSGTQANRNLVVNLGTPTGATLGSRSTHTLKIIDTTMLTLATSTYTTNGNTVTYSGACDLALGSVTISGSESATVTCTDANSDGIGEWTWTTSIASTDASRSYTISQGDGISSITQTGTWTRDTVVTAFSGLALSPTSPGIDPTPTLSGTTEANATITLYKDNACSDSTKIVGASTANGSGAFNVTPGYRLGTSGSLNLYVKATDALGNTLCSSAQAYVLKAPTLDLAFMPSRNLLSYSEQLEQSAWYTFGTASISANAATAPDGTLTADKLIEDTSSNAHNLIQDHASVGQQTFSIYAKAGERTILRLAAYNSTDGTIERAFFDLTSGTVVNGNGTIQKSENGWFRCQITFTNTVPSRVYAMPATSSTIFGYTGDNSSGLYLWGAQLETSSTATDYVPTTSATARLASLDPRVRFTRASGTNVSPGTYFDSSGVLRTAKANLLLQSEAFDDTTWVKEGASTTANSTVAPDGSSTADKIVEDSANAEHGVKEQYAGFTSGLTYTFSVFAKAGERSVIRLLLPAASFTSNHVASFTLTGSGTTAVIAGSPTSVEITPLLNGWYRCAITAAATTTAAGSIQLRLMSGLNTVYQGDGTSGIYIWGAQLEEGSSASSYVPTTTAINYLPRFDYDPATKSARGLLIEEQRTNLITDSAQFNDATATILGASFVSNATTAPDGTSTAVKIVEDTNSSQHVAFRNNIAFTGNITYTFSLFLKAAGRTRARLHQGSLLFTDSTARQVLCDLANETATLAVGNNATTSLTKLADGWYRCSITFTPNNSSPGRNISVYLGDGTEDAGGSYTGDGTSGIYVWGAQLEQGAFPTSYIPTTTVAMTRSSDIVNLTSLAWLNTSAGTVISKQTIPTEAVYSSYFVGANRTFWSLNAPGSSNYISPSRSWNGVYTLSLNNNGSSLYPTTNVDLTGTTNTTAISWETGNVGYTYNGVSPSTNASFTVPTTWTSFDIGKNVSWNYLNGHIRSLQYYNERLPNATLQSASAP